MRWLVVLVALASVGVVLSEGPAKADVVLQNPRPVVTVGDFHGLYGSDVRSYDFPDSIAYSEPSVMRVSGGPPSAYMWYCASAYGKNFIGLRTSNDDGKGWSATANYFLVGTGGNQGACAPSVVKVGGPTGYYYIAFESKSAPTTEWPTGAPGLFVARMKSPTGVVEYWNGAGWSTSGAAPLALGWTELWAPSLVVRDGQMFVYYTHTRQGENQGGSSWLRVATAPLSDNWPAQLTRQSMLMQFPPSPAGLDVKWSPTMNRFVAMGITATRQPMAYVSTGPDGLSFTEPYVDLLNSHFQAAQQPEDLAMAGDVSGGLIPGSWLVYQEASQLPYTTLRRARLAMHQAEQGAYSDTFASGAAWWPSVMGNGGYWTHDATNSALVYTTAQPLLSGTGTNTGTGVLAGDGLYSVQFEYSRIGRPGLQIGRVHSDELGYQTSGYTVFVGPPVPGTSGEVGRVMLYKAGGDGIVATAEIPNWHRVDTHALTLRVLKQGGRLKVWLDWPGKSNLATPLIDWPDHFFPKWGTGFPALIVSQIGVAEPVSTVKFHSFTYTPAT